MKKLILLGIMSIITSGLIIKACRHSNGIQKNGVYSVALIEDVTGAYQGRHVYISYKFRGSVFKADFVTSEIKISDKGKRFFLKIDAARPENFALEYSIQVPDSINESPYNGWDSLSVKGLDRLYQ